MIRPFARFLCVAIAVVAILSHVCVLPGHAHASIEGGPIEEEDATDEHGSSESLHAASCEAVVSTSGTVPTPAVASIDLPLDLVNARSRDAAISLPPRAAESPPLFLLHAALLI